MPGLWNFGFAACVVCDARKQPPFFYGPAGNLKEKAIRAILNQKRLRKRMRKSTDGAD